MTDKKNENLDSEDFELIADEATSSGKAAPTNMENSAEVDVDDLKSQLHKASSDYLYLRAEFDNFRKQSIKERSDLLRYGGERLAKDLFDSLDIFETALASEVSAENFKVFVDGIKMTSQSLMSTLQKHGITDVPCEGKAFDPAVNEALGSEPTDKLPPGYVTKVFKKPYKFHDKVLRTGQVIVAKAKE
ncbi:MAG: nucleotide exchange factor GrpE [Bdellovibrionaceae bacterium]|nr:nucleotide exchange factor GrpE [Pseudobdellovibrionaceae bacterium]